MQPLQTADTRTCFAPCSGLSFAVAANLATGFGDPMNSRRNSAPIPIAGAFFVPACPVYGGCAWETFGSAGFLDSRFANPRTAATLNRLATVGGSSSKSRSSTMHALNPSKIRAAAYWAMDTGALRAISSAAVRLRRYHHMSIAHSMGAAWGGK